MTFYMFLLSKTILEFLLPKLSKKQRSKSVKKLNSVDKKWTSKMRSSSTGI